MNKLLKKFSVGIILSICLFSACKEKFIPKRTMVKIITELYIVDGTVSRYGYELSKIPRDSIKYYAPVFERYGYNSDIFRESMVYYAGISGGLEDIYKKVAENLRKQKNALAPEVRFEELSKNMWLGSDSITLDRNKSFNSISSETTLKEKGVYDISVDYFFFQDDSTINPRMQLYLYSLNPVDSTTGSQDTLVRYDTILIKDTTLLNYQFTIKFDDERFNKLKVNWFVGDSVNLVKIPKYTKVKNKKIRTDDSIVGKQHLQLKNMSIRYNFDKSDFDYNQSPATKQETQKLEGETYTIDKQSVKDLQVK